jgi:hypothetical protein
MRIAMGLLGLAAVVVTPATAHAYRTYADDRGLSVPMAREQSTVQVVVRGSSVPGLSSEELGQVVGDAVLAWRSDCSPIEVVLLGASDRQPSPFDGLTSVVVLTEGWEARGYAPNQAGVADLFLVELPDRLAVRDADVFINADTVDWTAPGAPDLRTIVQHELGHALFGLGHVCGDSGAPTCTEALRASSIMAADYEVVAHEPRPDDFAGACALLVSPTCTPSSCGPDEYCDGMGCVTAEVCGDGSACEGVCAIAGPAEGMCQEAGGEGAPCASGRDCATNLCLTVPRESASYCTRSCGTADDCAGGQACRLVDDIFVCGPVPRSSSCTATPTRHPPPIPFAFATLLWLVSSHGRRARQLRGSQ